MEDESEAELGEDSSIAGMVEDDALDAAEEAFIIGYESDYDE